mmetsp:Transcript_32642/g.74587  ORF Transcript_32642/g.74587 Transcript_32642/m.74587 type:complete len:201 (+) Transcript_32642:438-1040(+)
MDDLQPCQSWLSNHQLPADRKDDSCSPTNEFHPAQTDFSTAHIGSRYLDRSSSQYPLRSSHTSHSWASPQALPQPCRSLRLESHNTCGRHPQNTRHVVDPNLRQHQIRQGQHPECDRQKLLMDSRQRTSEASPAHSTVQSCAATSRCPTPFPGQPQASNLAQKVSATTTKRLRMACAYETSGCEHQSQSEAGIGGLCSKR